MGDHIPLRYTFSRIGQIKWTRSGTLYIADSKQRWVAKLQGCHFSLVLDYHDTDRRGCPEGVAAGLDHFIYLSSQKEASGEIIPVQPEPEVHARMILVEEHMVDDKTQKIKKPGWMALDPIRNRLFFTDDDCVGVVLLFFQSTGGIKRMPPSTLRKDLSKLMDDPNLSDVSFTVEGKQLRGCRAVLAARSEYFKAIFESQMLQATQLVIAIEDAKYEAFRSVLIYLHTCNTDVVSDAAEIIRDMYTLADRYRLDFLTAVARKKLVYKFTIDNVVGVYQLAVHLGDMSLSNACIEMISRNVEMIEETEYFKQLDKDMKLQIYSSVVKCVKATLDATLK